MSSNRLLFERSLAALALVNNAGERRPRARALGPGSRLGGGQACAMSILFAPEAEPTANVLELGEHQTTGPLPLDFEFEFFGVRYAWFNLSSDGLVTFTTPSSLRGSGSHPRRRSYPGRDDLGNFIALGWTDVDSLGRKRVAYEIRGAEQRRRLVLSCTALPGVPGVGARTIAAQLVLHERTGMVDVYTLREDAAASKVAIRYTTSPGDRTRAAPDSRAH